MYFKDLNHIDVNVSRKRKLEDLEYVKSSSIYLYNRFISDKDKILLILEKILDIIPKLTFSSGRISGGLDISFCIDQFQKVCMLIQNITNISGYYQEDETNTSRKVWNGILCKCRSLYNILISWLVVTDSNLLLSILNCIPNTIKFFCEASDIICNCNSNSKVNENRNKDLEDNKFTTDFIIRQILQIYGCLSIYNDTKIRVACIYGINILLSTRHFKLEFIYDAFLPPISPTDYIKKNKLFDLSMNGDTTNPAEFKKSVLSINSSLDKYIASHGFSNLFKKRMDRLNGESNELYDKGWLLRRLDDESASVRFEVLMLIYRILIIESNGIKNKLLSNLRDTLFDCFLDDHQAIQSLVAEILILFSSKYYLEEKDLPKLLPVLKDSNIYTRYNALKVLALSRFHNVDVVHTVLMALLDSPLLYLDKNIVYNVFSCIALNHSTMAPILVSTLFQQYSNRKEDYYHVNISIFLFWSLWKTPSIAEQISLDFLLLYPYIKSHFAKEVPYLRLRLSYYNFKNSFQILPQHYNANILNHAFALYHSNDIEKELHIIGSADLKPKVFLQIGNRTMINFINNQTILGNLTYSLIPPDIIIESVLKKILSRSQSMEMKLQLMNSFYILYKILKCMQCPKIKSYYLYYFWKKMSYCLQYLGIRDFHEILEFSKSLLNDRNMGKMYYFKKLLPYSPPWPVDSRFHREICYLLNDDHFQFSEFIISAPDACGSRSYAFHTERLKSLQINEVHDTNKARVYCLNKGASQSSVETLLCQCLICRFSIHCETILRNDVDYLSKTIIKDIKRTILKWYKIPIYKFPCKISLPIPIEISFDIKKSEHDRCTHKDPLNLFIYTQELQILYFKKFEISSQYLKSLKRGNPALFGFSKLQHTTSTINFYEDKISTGYSFSYDNIRLKKSNVIIDNEMPIRHKLIPWSMHTRQFHVYPIAGNAIRLTSFYSVDAHYKRPYASAVPLSISLMREEKSHYRSISNPHTIMYQPTVMV
ncbi:hypothetical protein ACR3K2_03920 [Cryptosporidium serpentis]